MSDEAKKQFSKLKSAFTKRLKTLFAQTLEPLGFTLAPIPGKRYRWERASDGTPQYCVFFYNASTNEFWFTYGCFVRYCRDCWANAPCDAETQETLDRFFRAFESGDKLLKIGGLDVFFWPHWFVALDFQPKTADDVDAIYAEAEARLLDVVVPFLQRFREPSNLLSAYDAGLYEYRVKLSSDVVFDHFIDGLDADFKLAVARFQVGQYAEAATHFELAAEKALADDSWNAPNDYWRLYAKAMQIGALSVRKTVEEKGPGPTPPRPKRRWRDLEIPPELVNYPNRNEICRLLERAASPYEVVANKALGELEILKAQEICRPTSQAERDAATEERQKQVERLRVLFYGNAEDKKTLERHKRELKKRFREKFQKLFATQGFVKDGSSGTYWESETQTLCRYSHFSFHKGYLCLLNYGYAMQPDFSIWDAAPQDAKTQDVVARWRKYVTEHYELRALSAHRQRYWDTPTNDAELETTLNEVDEELENVVLPFFNRFRETSDVLRAVDAGEVDAKDTVAEDIDWRLYHLAVLRFQAGRTAEAAACLRELVENAEKRSAQALDWAKLRAEAARVGLLALEKTLAESGDAAKRDVSPQSLDG